MPITAQSCLFSSYSVYLKEIFGPMYHGYVATEVYRLGEHQGTSRYNKRHCAPPPRQIYLRKNKQRCIWIQYDMVKEQLTTAMYNDVDNQNVSHQC